MSQLLAYLSKSAPSPIRQPTSEQILEFVNRSPKAPDAAVAKEPTARLSLHIPAELHARFEAGCARRRLKTIRQPTSEQILEFVNRSPKAPDAAVAKEPTARLSLHIPAELHARFEAGCARRRLKMTSELPAFIEIAPWPGSGRNCSWIRRAPGIKPRGRGRPDARASRFLQGPKRADCSTSCPCASARTGSPRHPIGVAGRVAIVTIGCESHSKPAVGGEAGKGSTDRMRANCGRSENALRTRQFDRRVRWATSRSDASASDCVQAALRTTAGVCEPRASRQTGASNDGHL